MDLLDICGITVIAIGYFVLVPILIYYLHQFVKLKKTETMKHRKYKLVYCKNTLSIIGILFERALFCSVTVWNVPWFDEYQWLIYVSDGIFVYSVFGLFSMKIWLLFYSIGYHESLAKSTWKKEINPHYKSWYILHKDTFGNFNCIMKMMLLPFIAYIFMEIYVEIMWMKYVSMPCLIALSFLLLIPSLILYRKLESVHDVFAIKKEIGYQCIILLIIMLFYIALWIVYLYDIFNTAGYRLEGLIETLIGSIILFLMSFISTVFPVHQHRKLPMDALSFFEDISSSNNDNMHSIGLKSMIHVLGDEQGFNGFMMHLVHEFSTESLLFIYEYVQIKHEFQLKCNKLLKIPKVKSKVTKPNDKDEAFVTVDLNADRRTSRARANGRKISSIWDHNTISKNTGITTVIFNVNGSIFSRIQLPSAVPKSELLDKKEKFIDQLYELYLKYIKRGSALEINISCIQRKRITNAFNKTLNRLSEIKNEEEKTSDDHVDEHNQEMELNFNMFTVMDGACVEMLLLMSQSYARFTQTRNGIMIPIVSELNDLNQTDIVREQPTIHKKRTLSLEILRNGSSYSKLREHYDP